MNFTVADNRATHGGDNIFGMIGFCGTNSTEILHVPDNDNHNPSSTSSHPEMVCIDLQSDYLECRLAYTAHAYPGESITLSIYMVGQMGGIVGGTVLAIAGDGVAIEESEQTQEFGIFGGNATYTLYQTSNFSRATLTLRPVEQGCTVENPQVLRVTVNFLECPFGFSNTKFGHSGLLMKCQCDPNSVIVECDIRNRDITKKAYSWLGTFEVGTSTYLATNHFCPLDYCDPAIRYIHSGHDFLDSDEQCQYNRTGVLCGSCPEGWSMVLGSSDCRECSSVWLLLIIPFLLAGLLLVVVIQFLNLTVREGTICGLIFYANILQDYSVVLLSKYHPIPVLTPILQVFLSWLNLDLGITTCFYNGMEAFGKTMLLFVFPIYIWLISGIIVFLSSRFSSFAGLVGENATKVLSTLILLSYSKMLRIAVGILHLKILKVHVDSSTSWTEARWAVDGNIPYFDTQTHLVLFVLAIVSIVLLLPFSLYLLCIQVVTKFKVLSWIDKKLKPFFDTYTGPFKDKARFWTGLLLFVRMLLLIVGTLDYKNSVIPFYIIIATCLFLLAFMFILGGVYKKNNLNILELFFILNICVIFLINTYEGGSDIWISIVSHLLLSLVLLSFLGIIGYHTYLKVSKQRDSTHHDGEGNNEGSGYRYEELVGKDI